MDWKNFKKMHTHTYAQKQNQDSCYLLGIDLVPNFEMWENKSTFMMTLL